MEGRVIFENLISIVDWVEKNEVLDGLLIKEANLTTHSMDQGFEAKVVKICLDEESFVLKVWNKNSKPDVGYQYHLLTGLFDQGLSVSKPLGWGINPNGDKVLLTTFDGIPVLEVNEKKMAELAKILSRIHQDIGNMQHPKYDFIEYFFPEVREHIDIYHALISLVQTIQIEQDNLIHGDFHLRNIVEKNDQYTVIDWTNGQLGDTRYDFAWALTLLKIYVSEQFAYVFRSAYLLDNDIKQKELEVFEALACLRWILLDRGGGVPIGPNTIMRVKNLIVDNPFLIEFKLTL